MAVSMFMGLCTCHCLARSIYFLLVGNRTLLLAIKAHTHMHTHACTHAHTQSSQVPGRNALLMQGKDNSVRFPGGHWSL